MKSKGPFPVLSGILKLCEEIFLNKCLELLGKKKKAQLMFTSMEERRIYFGDIRYSHVSSVLLYCCGWNRHWVSRTSSKIESRLYLACVCDWKELLTSTPQPGCVCWESDGICMQSHEKTERIRTLSQLSKSLAAVRAFCIYWLIFHKAESISHLFWLL